MCRGMSGSIIVKMLGLSVVQRDWQWVHQLQWWWLSLVLESLVASLWQLNYPVVVEQRQGAARVALY